MGAKKVFNLSNVKVYIHIHLHSRVYPYLVYLSNFEPETRPEDPWPFFITETGLKFLI